MDAITVSSPSVSLPEDLNNDIFISYSRKDQEFVRQLDVAFRQLGRDPWVDWDDIQKGEEWWKAIQRGIEAAHTFVFVLSPDSVESQVCRQEIEHAAQHNKRFLPIVRREGFDWKQLHPSISSHNWLFFRETDDFDPAFQELIRAIDLDLTYMRNHSRYLTRALEWQGKGNSASCLLWGSALREAQDWLTQGMTKSPQPTELQAAFIQASQQAELQKIHARQKARWVVLVSTVVANLAIAAASSVWFYNYVTTMADRQIKQDLERSLNTGLISIDGDRFEKLVQRRKANPNLSPADPLYREHQQRLLQVHSVFPHSYPRTFIKDPQPGQARWVGDVMRELPAASGSQKQQSEASQFWNTFPARPAALEIYTDSPEAVDLTPYQDELGNWVSAFGAIRNSAGQVVGALRVDCRAEFLQQVQGQVRDRLLLGFSLIFLWLILLSLLILRVTQPSQNSSEVSTKL